MKDSKNIRRIIQEVNETLTDSHELDSSQRNALMLVHLITNVEEMITRVTSLEHLVDDHKTMYTLLEHRVKVLEDNSIANVIKTMLGFMKENPKFIIGLVIGALTAYGAAPELIKVIAVMAGIDMP